MYVFTSNNFEGELIECNEGDLKWIDIEKLDELNQWEGDKIFLDRIKKDVPFFTAKLEYYEDTLVKYEVYEY